MATPRHGEVSSWWINRWRCGGLVSRASPRGERHDNRNLMASCVPVDQVLLPLGTDSDFGSLSMRRKIATSRETSFSAVSTYEQSCSGAQGV